MKWAPWVCGAVGAVVFLAAGPASADNWPQFRGPTGFGTTSDRDLPTSWGGPGNENVLWSSPLNGQGHASPIVWGDRVFVCTANWPPTVADRAKVIPEQHVACYRVADGKLLWDTIVPPGPWLRSDFRSGPGGGYASATPTTDGSRVYCLFGSSTLAALDFDGHIVWRKDIVPYTFDVAIGGSPVLFRDAVIVFCPSANPDDSRVLALDKTTGDTRWQQKLPGMGFGHSTPAFIEVKGKTQMLLAASGMQNSEKALRALDPTSGKVVWWCAGAGDVATPVYGSGLVYFDSGRGSAGYAVDPSGSGDVTRTHVRWTIASLPEALSSPVIVEKRLYRLCSPGWLRCWDMDTGKPLYSERLEGVSSTWASPVADGAGRIYFATAGKSCVIQAGAEFKIRAVNDLGDPNHASPAVSNGRMFLVGTRRLYCVGRPR